MKAQRHSLTNVREVRTVANTIAVHAHCAACNTNVRAEWNGASWTCPNRRTKVAYGEYVKLNYCEKCGFTPRHGTRSLKVHHTSGSKSYDSNEVLKTVCGNCHDEMEDLVGRLLQGFNNGLAEFTNLQNQGFFTKDFWITSTRKENRS